MIYILAACAVLIAIAAILNVRKYPRSKTPGVLEHPYELRPAILTAAENRFFTVLRNATPAHLYICPMVRLADVIEVIKDTPNWQRNFNRISSKHIDFIICDSQTFEPIIGIELDDRSHDKQNRKARDTFVNESLENARLPLLRFKVSPTYNTEEVRNEISKHTRLKQSIPPLPPLSKGGNPQKGLKAL